MLLVTQKLKQEFWKCLYVVFPKQLLERFVDLKSQISDDFVRKGISSKTLFAYFMKTTWEINLD